MRQRGSRPINAWYCPNARRVQFLMFDDRGRMTGPAFSGHKRDPGLSDLPRLMTLAQ